MAFYIANDDKLKKLKGEVPIQRGTKPNKKRVATLAVYDENPDNIHVIPLNGTVLAVRSGERFRKVEVGETMVSRSSLVIQDLESNDIIIIVFSDQQIEEDISIE